jgi:hypothetical protein
LQSPDLVVRHFAYLIASLIAMAALYCLLNPIGVMGVFGAPLCTLWAVVVAALASYYVEGVKNGGHNDRMVWVVVCSIYRACELRVSGVVGCVWLWLWAVGCGAVRSVFDARRISDRVL